MHCVFMKLMSIQWPGFLLLLLTSCVISCKKEDESSEPLYKVDFTFAFDDPSQIVPATIYFTNTSEGATSYYWDFGDFNYSTGSNAVHTYTQPGDYTVTLTAQFPDGGSLSKAVIIKVLTPAAPVAAFTADPDTCNVNVPVSFLNTSAGAISYSWAFGDGQFSSQENPIHSYTQAGVYTVTLTATNAIGQTDTDVKNIWVTTVPFPGLTQISIGQVVGMYQGSNMQLGYGNKIIGTVVSDRSNGNIASNKNMVLWDGSQGILLRFINPHSYDLGERVVINLNTCVLKSYFGNIQLDSIPASNAVQSGTGVAVPAVTTISQIQQNPASFTSGLVTINNVTLSGGNGDFSGTVSVSDGVSSILLYTYPGATFINQLYPVNTVNMTALVQLFNGVPQLNIRNLNDIQ